LAAIGRDAIDLSYDPIAVLINYADRVQDSTSVRRKLRITDTLYI
jgi:hypothetical protein